jgi:Protein of unknown function (DUF2380)
VKSKGNAVQIDRRLFNRLNNPLRAASMKFNVSSLSGRTTSTWMGVALLCNVMIMAGTVRAETVSPIKIAVFDFELEDYSAGGGVIGATPDDVAQLKRATDEARQLLMQSGRYMLVDVSHAVGEPVKAKSLRMCGGCEADIAQKIGAEQSFVGVVARSSRTEYAVGFQIRDARNGSMLFKQQTDLRMGTNDSWNRGVIRLMKNTLLDN